MPSEPQAVLLAAGPAHRLLPLTEHRPKGMLLIGGRPLLQHAVEALAAHGVRDVVVVIGAHGERIQSFFKDGADFGLAIRYVHQAEPTGTLPALRLALPEVDRTRPLWVLSGHAYVTQAMLEPLARSEGSALLLADAAQDHPQGVPTVRGDRLVGMHLQAPVPGSTRVSTALMRLGPDLLEAVEAGAFEDQSELDLALGRFAETGGEVKAVPMPGAWQTVVEPWDVLRLNERVLAAMPSRRENVPRGVRASGAVHVGENSHIAPTATLVGPVTIGDGCSIGDQTVVGPYVSVRNNSIIGSHCEVRRSILNNNVVLDSLSLVRGCILDDGVQVAPGFISHESSTPQGQRGAILGRDARVGPGVRALAGAVLEQEALVNVGGILEA